MSRFNTLLATSAALLLASTISAFNIGLGLTATSLNALGTTELTVSPLLFLEHGSFFAQMSYGTSTAKQTISVVGSSTSETMTFDKDMEAHLTSFKFGAKRAISKYTDVTFGYAIARHGDIVGGNYDVSSIAIADPAASESDIAKTNSMLNSLHPSPRTDKIRGVFVGIKSEFPDNHVTFGMDVMLKGKTNRSDRSVMDATDTDAISADISDNSIQYLQSGSIDLIYKF